MTTENDNEQPPIKPDSTTPDQAPGESSPVLAQATPPTVEPTRTSHLVEATPSATAVDRPARRGPSRVLIGYVAAATLVIVGGGAWIYVLGVDFWPILAISIGSLMLAAAIARWQRSWKFGLGATVIVAAIIGVSYYLFIGHCPCETKIAVRVADLQGNPVSRANVILLHGGETPVKQATDSNGMASFIANSTLGEARLVVGASDFQVYEETINLSHNHDLSISLHSLNEDLRTVLVRVVNKNDLHPINKAEVQLIVGSDPFKEFTDDNGLAKFHIKFSSKDLDANLTVGAEASKITNQNVVLYPDQLQDVRIDTVTQVLNVAPILTQNRQDVGKGQASVFIPDQASQNIQVFLDAPTIPEREPNDKHATAQLLSTIGANHPVAAEINAYKDVDNFAFDAIAGQSYVVELYAVDSTLGLATSRYNCFGWDGTFKGLRLAIYDPADNAVAWQCAQNAGGNTFEAVRVKAVVSGRYVIEVAPQAETVVGKYRLRIAPKYDEKGAAWIENTLEPNNDPMNAFPIKPGLENAITSAIESHSSGYLSDQADVDWYTFNAQAGRTYVVEIYNVEDLLSLGSTRYNCYEWDGTFNGLGLAVLNPNLDLIKPSCMPTGAGDVHNIIEFTAQVAGPYYIRVFPQVATVSGIYSIRILPKHDEPGAAQDPVTLEPNNRQANAAAMDLKDRSSVISAFEERTPGYSTNAPDVDWYHFPAKAGVTYVIEVVNVADTLKLGTNRYNCYGSDNTFKGVGIAIFNAAAELQAAQCYPKGEGEVHTSVEFQALLNSEYYIHVFPHFAQGYGAYQIRIRTK